MLKRKLKSFLQNERGMALVLVLVVSTALALVGTSYLSTSTQEAGLITEQVQDVQALYAAESGIQYARRQLITYSNWTDTAWVPSDPINTGIGSATLGYSYDAGVGTITSAGSYQGHTKSITSVVIPVPKSPYTKAGCSCGDLILSNNVVTNSYDSNNPAYAESQGDLGTNGTLDLSKAKVYGNVYAKTYLEGDSNCEVTGTATVRDISSTYLDPDLLGGAIQGGFIQNDDMEDPCDCDALDLASLRTSVIDDSVYSNITVTTEGKTISDFITGTDFIMPDNGDSVHFNAGAYYFTNFQVTNGGTITVDSNDQVIIYIDLAEGDSSGTIKLKLDNVSNFNTQDNANNLRIYSNADITIQLDQNSVLAGAIYAPNATINMLNNSHIYGAMISGTINLANRTNLHFDNSLTDTVMSEYEQTTEVTVRTTSWSQD